MFRSSPYGLRADAPPFRHIRDPARVPRLLGLFSGIGGFERGFHSAGHHSLALAEIEPQASEVLRVRFPNVPNLGDIRKIRAAPKQTEMICGGFPCSDISQAGGKIGMYGDSSSLAFEILRLIDKRRVPVVVLENVKNILFSGKGRAMAALIDRFERMGYRWAYRLVDARSFGYNQRRERIMFVFSNEPSIDPRRVLFADNAAPPPKEQLADWRRGAFSFSWTEGQAGAGWGHNVVGPLRVGSGLGIPSAPAIVLRSGQIITPDIRDAELLQGFPEDWTSPAAAVGDARGRWKLVGNAIPVRMAAWVGLRLRRPGECEAACSQQWPIAKGKSWPKAGWGGPGIGRFEARGLSAWPFPNRLPDLEKVLRYPGTPLSARATSGFLTRLLRGRLHQPPGFVDVLQRHIARMEQLEAAAKKRGRGARSWVGGRG